MPSPVVILTHVHGRCPVLSLFLEMGSTVARSFVVVQLSFCVCSKLEAANKKTNEKFQTR